MTLLSQEGDISWWGSSPTDIYKPLGITWYHWLSSSNQGLTILSIPWKSKKNHSLPYIYLNTLRLRQSCRHFTDDIFKCIFLNAIVWLLLKISLKFVPKVRINNIPALVKIMAWHWPGINLREISQEIPQPWSTKFSLKIMYIWNSIQISNWSIGQKDKRPTHMVEGGPPP